MASAYEAACADWQSQALAQFRALLPNLLLMCHGNGTILGRMNQGEHSSELAHY